MYKAREFRMMAQLERLCVQVAQNKVDTLMARDGEMTEWSEADKAYIGLLIFDGEYHEMRSRKLDEIADALEGGE